MIDYFCLWCLCSSHKLLIFKGVCCFRTKVLEDGIRICKYVSVILNYVFILGLPLVMENNNRRHSSTLLSRTRALLFELERAAVLLLSRPSDIFYHRKGLYQQVVCSYQVTVTMVSISENFSEGFCFEATAGVSFGSDKRQGPSHLFCAKAVWHPLHYQ